MNTVTIGFMSAILGMLSPSIAGTQKHLTKVGLNQGQINTFITAKQKKGYRLRSISGYATLTGPKFSIVMAIDQKPKAIVKTGLTPEAFKVAHQAMIKRGAQLVFADGYNEDGQSRLVGYWRRGAARTEIQTELDRPSLLAADEMWRKKGWFLANSDAYSVGASAKYLGIWRRGEQPHRLEARLTVEQLNKQNKRLSEEGFNLVRISGYQTTMTAHYLALWHKTKNTRGVVVHPAVDGEHLPDVLGNLAYSGYRVQQLDGRQNPREGLFALFAEKMGTLPASEIARIDRAVETFQTKYKIPGLSIAFSRNDQVLFAKGYGVANPTLKWPISPQHRFRLAGLSKVITALATFKLMELYPERINLNSRIFGPGGLLTKKFDATPLPNDVQAVTVGHLLRHTSGGWSRGHECTSNEQCGSGECRRYQGVMLCDREDPMPQQLAFNRDQLLQWVLSNRSLQTKPGTLFRHSHFGYALLGRVIEAISDSDYETFVLNHLLKPAGITEMSVEKPDTTDAQARREVKYTGGSPYSIRMHRLDATQGWIGSSLDFLKLLSRADQQPVPKDLLSKKSLDTMKRKTPPNTSFGAGWYIGATGFVWHDGAMDGSQTLAVQSKDGLSWVILTNHGPGDDARRRALLKLGQTVEKFVRSWSKPM